MKSTWPMQELCVWDQTPPIFHLLALVFDVGGNTNFTVCVGGNANFTFLDTKMLVFPMRNCGVGGVCQRQDPTQMVLRRSGI